MYYRNKNKTAEYRAFQEEIRDELIADQGSWPFADQPVEFVIHVGLSSKLADLDNVLKPLFDTYQSIYEEFNDRTVYKITASKELVERGREYLAVTVQPFRGRTDGSEVPPTGSSEQEDESEKS